MTTAPLYLIGQVFLPVNSHPMDSKVRKPIVRNPIIFAILCKGEDYPLGEMRITRLIVPLSC